MYYVYINGIWKRTNSRLGCLLLAKINGIDKPLIAEGK
jgi:hypothetical protein